MNIDDAIRKLSLILVLTLAGCTTIIADAVANRHPNFAEVEEAAGAIPPNAGRVIVYFPRQGVGNTFNPVGIGGFVAANVSVDGKHTVDLIDRTFIWGNLEKGKHQLVIKTPGFDRATTQIPIDLREGQTVYVKIDKGIWEGELPKIVPPATARAEMQALDVRHTFRGPVPFTIIGPDGKLIQS